MYFQVKKINKKGFYSDSSIPVINNFVSDSEEVAEAFAAGCNASDIVQWRNRYKVIAIIDDESEV